MRVELISIPDSRGWNQNQKSIIKVDSKKRLGKTGFNAFPVQICIDSNCDFNNLLGGTLVVNGKEGRGILTSIWTFGTKNQKVLESTQQ